MHVTSPQAASARRALAAAPLAALLLFFHAACAEQVEGASVQTAKLQQLVDALDPPPPDSTSDIKNAYYVRRREVLAEMRRAGPELGAMALQLFDERKDAKPQIRLGLLEVAAINLGEEIAPRLTEIFQTYGEDLGERRLACELLAEVAPLRAVELLQPLIVDARPRGTLPPGEAMIQAWSRACLALGRDRTDVLLRISTDIYQDDRNRTVGIELLGQIEGPLPRQALETVLVESTGNGYVRRKAAQALRDTLPQEDACEIFERVIGLEADDNFQRFLADLIERNCP